ncbi:calcium-binding protein [Asticcacaulis sp. AC402]|uniref:calcium-binding protein n=1 Tax=Asticcacaulis sp. AC402 TaxID=1282361 RepID=UPI0003C3FB0F|nr:calcium-binding protein [Asticcacaulis sp. AC402]ESQ73750.1 hypothetical protein ABAC402_17560 [Asticcacaulis sp. AC402]
MASLNIFGEDGEYGIAGENGGHSEDGYTTSGAGGAGMDGEDGGSLTYTLSQIDIDGGLNDVTVTGGLGGGGGGGGRAGQSWLVGVAITYHNPTLIASITDATGAIGASGNGGHGGDGGGANLVATGIIGATSLKLVATGLFGQGGGYGGDGTAGTYGQYLYGTHITYPLYTYRYTAPGSSGGQSGNGGDGGDGGNSAVSVGGSSLSGGQFISTGGYGSLGGYGGNSLAGPQGYGGSHGGNGGNGGNGGHGGDAAVSIVGNTFTSNYPQIHLLANGGNAGSGGQGGHTSKGAIFYSGEFLTQPDEFDNGINGDGGDGGDGGDATIVFTGNTIKGTESYDNLRLSVELDAGAGGSAGAAGKRPFINDDDDIPGIAGSDGTDGQSTFTFSGNTIDGGLGGNHFGLDYRHVGEGASETVPMESVYINLTTGAFNMGMGANTIMNVADLDVSVSEWYYDANGFAVYVSLETTLIGSSDANRFNVYSHNRSIGETGNSAFLSGEGGNDSLASWTGNDVLDGGHGADTLTGGLGDDSYIIDSMLDQIIEAAGEGSDTVLSSITLTTPVNVESLVLTGNANVNATGSAGSDVLVGNAGNNALTGGGGKDNLSGQAGDDALDGGTNADVMTGGLGNDTFIIDNIGDSVRENHLEGTDTVISSISFSMFGRAVEVLTLTGAGNLNGTGNSLNNTITGTSGNNVLDGAGGGDILIGGLGDDTYYVDSAGDSVRENHLEGTDTVISSVSYSMFGRAVEVLTLTGSGNLNGTGNSLNNTITGTIGNNVLDGGMGGDKLVGGLGDDTYYVQSANDTVIELGGGGWDVIFSTVSYSLNGRYAEVINLTGTANINATGNSLANTLVGNDGMNTLNGKGGKDILSGGLGSDIFLFETGSGKDTITDFSAEQNDSININAYTAGVANVALVTQAGANVIVNLGASNTITVIGANQADVLAHMVW